MEKLFALHRHARSLGRTLVPLLALALMFMAISVLAPKADAAAGIYRPINYQGKLTSTGGVSITDGQYNMQFKIFSAASGGVPLWTETWNTGTQRVTATGGLFSIQLGTHVTMTGSVNFNTDNLYLQVEFDPGNDGVYEEIFMPRRRFASVPYAHNANTLDGLDSTQFLRSDTSTTASGTITVSPRSAAKIGIDILGTGSSSATGAIRLSTQGAPHIIFGSGGLNYDVNLFRVSAGILKTNGSFYAVGTVSGANLYAADSISGSYIYANKTFAGAGLTSCSASNSKLVWNSATKTFSCATDLTGAGGVSTGSLQLGFDRRFVNVSGDTMTGNLIIRSTSGASMLNFLVQGGMSGNYLSINKLAAFANSGVVISASGSTVFNEQSRDVDFRIESDTNANAFFVDASTSRIGMGTNGPKAALDVIGTISGTNIYAADSISGSYIYANKTFAGAGLTSCSNAQTSKLLWNATTKTFSCGVDFGAGGTSTGALQNAFDRRFVNVSGDTMTGNLIIRSTSGASMLNFLVQGGMSGNYLSISKNAVFANSGVIITATGQTVFNEQSRAVDFRVESDGNANMLFVDGSADRIGIGTNGPKATLDVVGTVSGTNIYAADSISGSYIYANKTFAGAGLTSCSNATTSKLLWNSTTKTFSCGVDFNTNWSNTGSLQSGFDRRYVNVAGDTMTGNLIIRSTSGASMLNFLVQGGMSGNYLSINKLAAFANSGVVISASGQTVFNEQSRDVDFRIESDTNANAFFVDASTSRVGIGTNGPKAALDTIGTISGTDLYSANSISGSYIYANKTFAGAGLTSCSASNSKLIWNSATKTFSCGTDQTGAGGTSTGALQTAFDRRFVNVHGDTMTGSLIIRSTSGSNSNNLTVLGGMSGNYLFINKQASFANSGVLISTTGATVFNEQSRAVDFRIESDGNTNMFFVDGSADRVGIGTVGPKATLDVLGTASGTDLYAANSISGSYLYAAKTFGGAGLASCSNAQTSKLLYNSATKQFTCGVDYSNGGTSTGALQNAFDRRYVNVFGDTMTGNLIIRSTSGASMFNFLTSGGMSGNYLSVSKNAVFANSGVTITASGQTVFNEQSRDVDFRIESDGDANMFFVDGSANRIGIGTNAPKATLDIVGTLSGRHLVISNRATFSGSVVLGDSSSDLVTIRSRLSGSLIPNVNNTYDLGSNTLRWRDLYLSGSTIYLGAAGDEARLQYNTTANRLQFDLGAAGTPEFRLTASGSFDLKEIAVDPTTESNYARIYARTGSGAGGNDDFTTLLLHSNDNLDNDANAKTNLSDFLGACTTTFANSPTKFGSHSWDLTSCSSFDAYRNGNFDDDYFISGNFTVDMWVYVDAHDSTNRVIVTNNAKARYQWRLMLNASNQLQGMVMHEDLSEVTLNSILPMPTDQWVHIALERHGNVFNLYEDGVRVDNETSAGVLRTLPFSYLQFANKFGGDMPFSGYLDEVRISESARYGSSGFTPPVVAYGDASPELMVRLSDGSIHILTDEDSGGGSDSLWTLNTDGSIFYLAGNVGIGIDVSNAALQVQQDIRYGSGALLVVQNAQYSTGAYITAAGTVLALEAQNGTGASKHILFGYRGRFDVALYRNGSEQLMLSGSLLPAANFRYDLGSDGHRWRDLYMSGGTIHLGETGNEGTISYNTSSRNMNFSVGGSRLQLFPNGDVTLPSLTGCDGLTTSSTGVIICGGNGSTISQTEGDRRYVNTHGDTMTGNLVIRSTSGASALNFLTSGGMSGNFLSVSKNAVFANSGVIITASGQTVFNEQSRNVDFRIESDGNVNAFFVDASTNRVGIGTNGPKATLDVLGTASGTDLYAANSISGSYLFAAKTFGGAGLASCSNAATSKLLYNSATKQFSCGTDQGQSWSNTGSLQTAFDNRYVNVAGDTMTGTLILQGVANANLLTLKNTTNTDEISMRTGLGNPNGSVSAQAASLFFATDTGKIWKNTDGATAWSELQSGSGSIHMVKMTSDAGQSINNNTTTQLTFNDTEFDQGNIADLLNDRIVVTKAGKYAATCTWNQGTAAGGATSIFTAIYKNGAIAASTHVYNGTNGAFSGLAHDVFSLVPGDYLECFVSSNGGSSFTLAVGNGQGPTLSAIQVDGIAGANAAGGSSLFTDAGAFTYLTDSTDNLLVGATGSANTKLEVIGTISGTVLHAQDALRSSGTLIVEGLSRFHDSVSLFRNGSIQMMLSSDATYQRIESYNAQPLALNAGVGANNVLMNLLSGKVGIGMGTPGSKLSVSGAVIIGANGAMDALQAQTGTALEVLGTASGQNLYATSSITGSHLYAAKTFGGAGLASCSAGNSKLLYNSATKQFSCGTDLSGGGGTSTGSLQNAFDNRYVNTSGDTMTGALRINLTTGTIGLNVLQTMSGNTLFVSKGATLAGTGITISASGSTVFNEQSRDVDFRIESDGNANAFFVDASTNRVGIGTNGPKATLDVLGTASGTDLYASRNVSGSNIFANKSISGTYLYAATTFGGAGLASCSNSVTSKLLYNSATKQFSCGTDYNTNWSNTGALQTGFDRRYVNVHGDTMTGNLLVRSSSGTNSFNLLTSGGMSGNYLSVSKNAVFANSGVVITSTGQTVFNEQSRDVDFRIESDGSMSMFFVDASANRVGIGTNGPKATLDVLGTASGTDLYAANSISGSYLYAAKTFGGAGLSSCNNGVSSKLMYNSATKKFECGTDQSAASGMSQTDGDARYVKKQGDTMTGALRIDLTTSGFLGLNIAETASGNYLHAEKGLSSSGNLTVNTTSLLKGNVTTQAQFFGPNGSNAAPTYSFTNSTVTGLSFDGTNGLQLNAGGVSQLIVYPTQVRVTVGGTAATPGISSGGGDTGIYFPTSTSMGFSTAGVQAMQILSTGNVGIGTNAPGSRLSVSGSVIINPNGTLGAGQAQTGTALEVIGTASGLNLFATNSVTGSHLYAAKTFGGAGLGSCSNSVTSKLLYNSTTKQFSCGTDQTGGSSGGNWSNTGSLQTAFDNRYVNTSGDTMTGALRINLTTGTIGLNVLQTMSGNTLFVSKGATLAGTGITISSSGSTVFNEQSRDVDFRIESDGNSSMFFVDGSTNRIGIGTNAPETMLEVAGIMSGSTVIIHGDVSQTYALNVRKGSSTAAAAFVDSTDTVRLLNGPVSIQMLNGASTSVEILRTGGANFNVQGNATGDFQISGDTATSLFFSDASADRVGINTNAPKATLDVLGTASGTDLYAANSISGSHLFAAKTFGGAGLASCSNSVTSKLLWNSATKQFSCGTDQTGGSGSPEVGTQAFSGSVKIIGDSRYVRKAGDTMTGALTIDLTGVTAGIGLKIIETASGNYIHAEKGLSSSGTLVVNGVSVLKGLVNIGGITGIGYNAISNGGTATHVGMSTDLFILGSLEVDGVAFFDSSVVLQNGEVIDNSVDGTIGFTDGSNTLMVILDNGTTGKVGIGTNNPKATLDVVGTASGTNLYAADSMSGSYIYANKTFAGAGLTDCDADNQTLAWDATTKKFVCGDDDTGGGSSTPEVGTQAFSGAVKIIGDSRYVRKAGDTMTGALRISLTSGTIGLNVLQTMSGDTLFVSKGATLAGTGITISASGSTVFNEQSRDVDFRIESDGNVNAFFVDASTNSIGVGKNNPKATLDVLGSISGSYLSIFGTMSGKQLVVTGTGGIKPLIFTSSANSAVGIGTNTPTQKLTVSGGTILNVAGGTPKTLSGVNIGGTDVTTITSAGRYAYVGSMNIAGQELKIIDTSNVLKPQVVGGVDFGTGITAIAVAGKYAYVGMFSNAPGPDLRIIDVSNPSSPKALSGVNLSVGINAITVAGKYAYVVTNTIVGNDFRIFDITNPYAPKSLSGVNLGTNGRGLSVIGKYAYVVQDATAGNELRVIDISNPLAPVIVGGADFGASGRGIAVVGRYAYAVNTGLNGTCSGTTVTGCEFRIYDISNPTSVSAVGGYNVTTSITERFNTVSIAGNYAYVGGGTTTTGGMTSGNDIRIFNVQNASAPVEVGSIEPNASVSTLLVSGKYLYAGLGNGDGTGVAGVEFLIYDANGIDAPSATIGTLGLQFLNVTNDAVFDNIVSVGFALNVGQGGIKSDGPLSIIVGSGGTIKYLTGATIVNRGKSGAVLALDSYNGNSTGSTSFSSHILFGYKGQYDTNLYRAGTGTLASSGTLLLRGGTGRTLLKLESTSATQGNSIFEAFSDNGQVPLGAGKHNRIFRFTTGGDAYADGFFNGGGADYAERFLSSTPGLKPGEAVCLDPLKENTVRRCDRSGDSNIMGVVSTKPAFVGDKYYGADGAPAKDSGSVLVGLIGQLPAKTIVENASGAIKIGDALAAAAKPGFIRKAKPGESTVGVALTNLASGQGTIEVLITRKNQSDLVAQIEEEVTNSIAEMNIGDQIAQMIQSAVQTSGIDASVAAAVQMQINAIDLAGEVNRVLDIRLGSNFSLNDLSVGALNVQSLNVNVLHAASISAESGGLLFSGPLVPGNGFGIGSMTFSGSQVAIGSLMSAGSLKVIGDVTIEGLTTFLGHARVQGELIVSGKQAGYAVVPTGGTSVTVLFQTGFVARPIVTASPDVPVLFAVSKAVGTGFTIRIAAPATEPITFSWHALSTDAPITTLGGDSDGKITLLPFPVDELGRPFSQTDPIWTSCVQGTVTLDGDGNPYNCSRYRVGGHTYLHPDLIVEFTYNPNSDPPVFTIPAGYELVTIANQAPSSSSSSSSEPAASSSSSSEASSSASSESSSAASSEPASSSSSSASQESSSSSASEQPESSSSSSESNQIDGGDGEVIDVPPQS